jgi:hypothetical protein
MENVYGAAGGEDGLLRLAKAWHARVMADEVVSHAFSHGFHPQHSERLAAHRLITIRVVASGCTLEQTVTRSSVRRRARTRGDSHGSCGLARDHVARRLHRRA